LSSACSCAKVHFAGLFLAATARLNGYRLEIESRFFSPGERLHCNHFKISSNASTMSPESTPNTEKLVPDEIIVKVAKEVAIKFIEVGRLTPGNFNETFKDLYIGIKATIRGK
jgi:hypothetical protein